MDATSRTRRRECAGESRHSSGRERKRAGVGRAFEWPGKGAHRDRRVLVSFRTPAHRAKEALEWSLAPAHGDDKALECQLPPARRHDAALMCSYAPTSQAHAPIRHPPWLPCMGGFSMLAAMLTVEPHPLLELRAFVARFSTPTGQLAASAGLAALLAPGAPAPMQSSDAVRQAVRDLLRHGGFKPTGRSKPASEYLARAAEEGRLGSINPAVDAGNAVSLHSGLPVSVVDLDRTAPPLRVAIAPKGSSYVFNAAEQVIDVAGLVCLFDAQGPCANAVKDAQRTKTTAETTNTLSIIWGTSTLPGRAEEALRWYCELARELGADVQVIV